MYRLLTPPWSYLPHWFPQGFEREYFQCTQLKTAVQKSGRWPQEFRGNQWVIKNLSCVPLKDCPQAADYYKTTSVYKRYKSEISIIRNAEREIRAVFGYCEIWVMTRCRSLFKQVYLSCIFNQLTTPGSSFIEYLCCLPSACNFPLHLFCQLNLKKKGPFFV